MSRKCFGFVRPSPNGSREASLAAKDLLIRCDMVPRSSRQARPTAVNGTFPAWLAAIRRDHQERAGVRTQVLAERCACAPVFHQKNRKNARRWPKQNPVLEQAWKQFESSGFS